MIAYTYIEKGKFAQSQRRTYFFMQKQYRLKDNNIIGSVVKRRVCARGTFYNVYFQKSDKYRHKGES